MSSAASEGLIEQLFAYELNAIRQLQAANYVTVSALCFVMWDTCLNIPREVQYIWKSSWSFPKFLYLLIRYYPVVCLLLMATVNTTLGDKHNVCISYMWWLCATTPQIMIIGANSILLLRIHALYGRNRKLLIALLFCVGVELGLEFYAGIKAAILATKNIIEAPAGIPLSGCLIVSNPFTFQFTLFAWIPCIFNALTFFLLTAYKFYEKVIAESQDSWRSLGRKDISPVLIAFVRDGTIFFFLW
ncbi:hypothetical protein M422DRAFT_783643 [Sphaerobolus stellatus SS14]|uniref:DUF6533 domain-containing protein n=1 Tax=Sphaerobolus stellatus (strain SS14) TaxID=990650 RepID=A0A0C9V3F0_SPHS4|nr:hypothetical protein M422DRAFT_783643 [Sphaerobolus stellatus SS14]